ncbi:MAG: hypothetical protein E7211_21360 [Clostridium lundense]|nr:hypothetical protein [Clostridium lundense]
MNYAIVDNGIVVNIIVADESFAEAIGALPVYDGCMIGEAYDPPVPPTPTDKLEAQVFYTAMMTDTLLPEEDEDDG